MEQTRTFKHGISGHVKQGFEPVIAVLENFYAMKVERNCQLCVYVKEECVIDVVMANKDKQTNVLIDGESLGSIYSSGKTVAAILLAKMVEQGRLEYDDPVSKHWPEFAQNGKEALTVADVMRHEGGMVRFNQALEADWLTTEGIKENKVGQIIEKETLDYPDSSEYPGIKREYHSETRDIIGNEIFRRVHPEGKTFGEYLKQDFGPEFGINGIVIGLGEEDFARKVPYDTVGGWQQMKEFYYGAEHYPTFLNMAVVKNFKKAKSAVAESRKNWPEFKRGESPSILYFNKDDKEKDVIKKYNNTANFDKSFSGIESPSANIQANARGLAKMAAYMANNGSLGGK